MGKCIITRRGGNALDLSTITHWAPMEGYLDGSSWGHSTNWYQASHATFPTTKLCLIHFCIYNDESGGGVFVIINNGKLLACIGNATNQIVLSITGNTITLTSNPGVAVRAMIGTN